MAYRIDVLKRSQYESSANATTSSARYWLDELYMLTIATNVVVRSQQLYTFPARSCRIATTRFATSNQNVQLYLAKPRELPSNQCSQWTIVAIWWLVKQFEMHNSLVSYCFATNPLLDQILYRKPVSSVSEWCKCANVIAKSSLLFINAKQPMKSALGSTCQRCENFSRPGRFPDKSGRNPT